MEIIYLTEPGLHDAHEAWGSLNDYIEEAFARQDLASGLVLESLSMEGFKEMARNIWEQMVIQIKKLITWITERLMSLHHRMERSRDRVEQVLSGLSALRTHRAPFDHVVVPMSANEYRHLSRKSHETVGPAQLMQANADLGKVSQIFFQAHVEYVKSQCGAIAEAFGNFDILNAETQLSSLHDKLAQLTIQGASEGAPIDIVGLAQIAVNNTTHPGIASLGLVTMRTMVQNPTSGFKAPSVTESIAVMANARQVLSQALQFHEQLRTQLEKLHGQLLHSGSVLMQHVKSMTEGSSDGSRIIKVVKDMLRIEAIVAKNIAPPPVSASNWICETTDAISSLMQRAVDAASLQPANKPGAFTPTLPAPQ